MVQTYRPSDQAREGLEKVHYVLGPKVFGGGLLQSSCASKLRHGLCCMYMLTAMTLKVYIFFLTETPKFFTESREPRTRVHLVSPSREPSELNFLVLYI